MRAQPHNCPDCGVYYAPRAEHERERCWSCAGVSTEEHFRAISAQLDEHELASLVTIPTPITPSTAAEPTSNGRPSTDDLLDALDGLF